jgi:hypothetical protein
MEKIQISTHQNALLQAQNTVFQGSEAHESYEKRLELRKNKVSAVKIEPQRHTKRIDLGDLERHHLVAKIFFSRDR